MKTQVLFLSLILTVYSGLAQVVEKAGFVAIEMESTQSVLGNWKAIKPGDSTFISGASGGVHLEFTGNNPSTGPADSPLEFSFTITNPGIYALLIRGSKRLEGLAEDKCNDCYVRIEGDFSSPYTGDPAKEPDYKGLSTNQKIFGGSEHPEMGWLSTLDYLGHIKKKPKYVFKAGQTYKIVFSGRAQRLNADYFVLYDMSKFTEQQAQLISPEGPLKVPEARASLSESYPSCWSRNFADNWDLSKPEYYKAKGSIDAANKAFQINTLKQAKNQWATAKIAFDGEAGIYDVKFTALLEGDGESLYKIAVDGKQILEFQNPRILGTSKKDYTPYVVGCKKIKFNKGAIIQVDFNSNSNGLVPEDGTFACARGRWRSISIGQCEKKDVDKWLELASKSKPKKNKK